MEFPPRLVNPGSAIKIFVHFSILITSQKYHLFLSIHQQNNEKLAQNFTCKDCGHTAKKPYPPMPDMSLKSAKGNWPKSHLDCFVLNVTQTSSEISAEWVLHVTCNCIKKHLSRRCESSKRRSGCKIPDRRLYLQIEIFHWKTKRERGSLRLWFNKEWT